MLVESLNLLNKEVELQKEKEYCAHYSNRLTECRNATRGVSFEQGKELFGLAYKMTVEDSYISPQERVAVFRKIVSSEKGKKN